MASLAAQETPSLKAENKAEKAIVIQDHSLPSAIQTKKRLVFLDFYNESNDANTKWLTNSVGDALYEFTRAKYDYTRIDNSVWRDYARKNNFEPKDFYDIEKLQKMGYALHLDGIIFGKFITTAQNIKITGKILSVKANARWCLALSIESFDRNIFS